MRGREGEIEEERERERQRERKRKEEKVPVGRNKYMNMANRSLAEYM